MIKELICNNGCEEYFDNFFNSLEEGVLLMGTEYDTEGEAKQFRIIGFNESFKRIFGNGRENNVAKEIEGLYTEIACELTETCRQISKTGRYTQQDTRFKIGDRYYKINVISPVKGQFITFFDDITDRIKAQEALKKYSLLFENAHDILLYLKADGSIIDANKTAVEKYGYSYDELLNMNIQQLRHPSMVVHYKEQMEISVSKGLVFEGIHVRKEGTSFPVEVSSRSIEVNGELLRIHIIRDITDRKEAEEKINYLANYDALTGIANRGFLMRQLEDILERSAKENLKFAVMLFDVDKFKRINDVYGHNAGDEVLKVAAERLRKAVGESDIVGRLGGDEFLVIETSIKDRGQSRALAERILSSVCKQVNIGDDRIDIRISLGIAIYPEHSEDKEGIIHCADTAMYSIKQKGGNAYNFYEDK